MISAFLTGVWAQVEKLIGVGVCNQFYSGTVQSNSKTKANINWKSLVEYL
jgi:hypothetical protein